MTQKSLAGVVTEFVRSSEGNIRLISLCVSPDNPWIVLWPGQGDPAESLFVLMERARHQSLNIAVFDPLGHGLSDEPRIDYSPKSQQIVWESVLDHLQVKQAYIGGYSYGAYSAAMCSEALAERIMGLILIEGGYLTMEQRGKTPESETKEIIESMRTYRYDSWEEALADIKSHSTTWTDYDEAELYVSMVERDDAIVLRLTESTIILMEQALADYTTSVLERFTSPILLLHSTLPPERAEMRAGGLAQLQDHAPLAHIVPIPDCGHTIKEHLPFVMDQIVKFIKG